MNLLQTLFRKKSCSKSQIFAIARSQFSQLLTKKLSSELPKNLTVQLNQRRNLIFIGENFLDTLKRDVEIPDDPYLPTVDRHPKITRRVPFAKKRRIDYRGPEPTVNYLLLRKCGIQATSGGRIKFEHFEEIRRHTNLKMDTKRMFAIWRMDPPYKPCTKKPLNSRMGGGKPNDIKFFVTPIKQERVLMELGGNFEFEEVEYWLKQICDSLPLWARPVSQEILDAEKQREKEIEANNINPFKLDDCIRDNFNNCQKWFSRYNQIWGGKYR